MSVADGPKNESKINLSPIEKEQGLNANDKSAEESKKEWSIAEKDFSKGSIIPTDAKMIAYAFDYALKENDITTIYWLLRKVPFFKYANNEKLKSTIINMFIHAWNYTPIFAEKFQRFLAVDEMFEELAILFLHVCTHSHISTMHRFVFEDRKFVGERGVPIPFIGKILQSRNLNLYEAGKCFVLTFLDNDMCLSQKLTNAIGKLSAFDLETFMMHFFTPDIHKKYPNFVLMCSQIPTFPVAHFSEETIDHADVEVDIELLPPKGKCYSPASFTIPSASTD